MRQGGEKNTLAAATSPALARESRRVESGGGRRGGSGDIRGNVGVGIFGASLRWRRIIYGPEYTLRENIERLRNRGLSTKRSLALLEFALGVEGLRRFVEGEPLYRVHECAFAVLALESEPVDPRL